MGVEMEIAYKLVVNFDTSQYQADSCVAQEIMPPFFVLGIEVCADVAHKIDSCRLGVSDVGDVVDVA